MAIDLRLVVKGKDEPRAALAQQLRVSAALAKLHEADLTKVGWLVADTQKLTANAALLESAEAIQADARGRAQGATRSEVAGRAHAKEFKRTLLNALPIALRRAGRPAEELENFEAGGALDRSTPKISAYLAKIRGPLVPLDAALKPFFGGASAVARLDAAKAELDGADTAQELALTELPEKTQQIYAVKGASLELIEDLNRLGKNAYRDNAVTAGSFNKDILVRGRKTRAPVEAPVEQTG
jgi:hypothetical protein